MNHVVKYYYSKPLYIGNIMNNPTNDDTSIFNIRNGKRYTIAAVYDDDDHTIKFGLAICMPKDNFNKKVGREIAYNRAITKPFHVINDFDGIRNHYADEVMKFMITTEKTLLKKEYPQIFNSDYIV